MHEMKEFEFFITLKLLWSIWSIHWWMSHEWEEWYHLSILWGSSWPTPFPVPLLFVFKKKESTSLANSSIQHQISTTTQFITKTTLLYHQFMFFKSIITILSTTLFNQLFASFLLQAFLPSKSHIIIHTHPIDRTSWHSTKLLEQKFCAHTWQSKNLEKQEEEQQEERQKMYPKFLVLVFWIKCCLMDDFLEILCVESMPLVHLLSILLKRVLERNVKRQQQINQSINHTFSTFFLCLSFH